MGDKKLQICRAFDRNSSKLYSILSNSDMELDVGSFLLFDNNKSFKFISDFVEKRNLAEDIKEIIKGVCLYINKVKL